MTAPSSTVPASRARSAVPGRIAALGVGAFALVSLVVGFLDPGYDPLREPISSLAAQDAGAPLPVVLGFLTAAVGLLVAGVTLGRRLRGPSGKAAGVLLVLSGAALAVCGVARVDCSQADPTCLAREEAGTVSSSHWVHQLVSLALFVVLLVVLPLLARAVRRTPGCAHLVRTARWVAVAGLVSFAVLVSQTPDGLAGVAQRLFLLVVLGWPALLTVRTGVQHVLRRPAAEGAPVPA